jgi:membrane protease YdiL (CAAX protease family)
MEIESLEHHDRAPSDTRRLWIEVFAVLCLGVLPYLWSAGIDIVTMPARHAHAGTWPFVHRELSLVVVSFQVAMPVLVIIALTKEPWSKFGIVRPIWAADLLFGCVVWYASMLAYTIARSGVPAGALDKSFSEYSQMPRPGGFLMGCLALAMSVAIAFSEELVMRGYLLPRFERLLGATWRAVLVTSLLFGACHLYQGYSHAVAIAASGFVKACAFCLIRRLWPLVVAHALTDFLAWAV